jgi:hypothetical protein
MSLSHLSLSRSLLLWDYISTFGTNGFLEAIEKGIKGNYYYSFSSLQRHVLDCSQKK